jgi:parvulin-like peptidyl-prolyl isomerase
MRSAHTIALIVLLCGAGSVPAQQPTPLQTKPTGVPAPAPTVIAATVNGHNVQELAVFRALQRVPPSQRDVARKDVLQFLIDTALIDQYLDQLKVAVEGKEVDAAIKQMQDEAVKTGLKWDDVLRTMFLTEGELRLQLTNALRWDKFVGQYATDKAVKDYFEQNRTVFDGSQVRARHILLTPPPAGNPQAVEQQKAKLLALKKQVEDRAAQELAKVPAAADNLAREKARIKALEDAFAEAAARESQCESKKQGGDLGWFPRAGRITEDFTRVAFALKPYQMSDVVQTGFGLHLILAVDQRPGREVKFEDIRDVVKEVFTERLRESILTQARPVARIVIQKS